MIYQPDGCGHGLQSLNCLSAFSRKHPEKQLFFSLQEGSEKSSPPATAAASRLTLPRSVQAKMGLRLIAAGQSVNPFSPLSVYLSGPGKTTFPARLRYLDTASTLFLRPPPVISGITSGAAPC
jgi:hypothetical protein